MQHPATWDTAGLQTGRGLLGRRRHLERGARTCPALPSPSIRAPQSPVRTSISFSCDANIAVERAMLADGVTCPPGEPFKSAFGMSGRVVVQRKLIHWHGIFSRHESTFFIAPSMHALIMDPWIYPCYYMQLHATHGFNMDGSKLQVPLTGLRGIRRPPRACTRPSIDRSRMNTLNS